MSNEITQVAEENFNSLETVLGKSDLNSSTSSKAIANPRKKSTSKKFFVLAVATCGIGYAPLMPGTIASALTSLLYFFIVLFETHIAEVFVQNGYTKTRVFAWLDAFNILLFVCFCALGIWASGKAVEIFKNKDPKEVVVDEVIGQLIAFMFIPLTASWKIILLGFIVFRLFDIFKPYPINRLQKLPSGFGVCADDILAGVYTGICLAFVYALTA
ncbi:MAG: phosphatidylglycerophosphatase A [Acidobacteria bacterium]|jgi:phosphatidylglycerophosphatase A|nr:MAG: phosphatidylglycerophosphatase A [Acidobacteriota bacterium]GIU81946.1 MAG: hypothetical protein KatS3mg006_1010 [Pyrinomonadaceae bacterium]